VTTWFTVRPPGRPPVALTGAELSAVPGALALFALAGVAAVVATRGPVRRAVGLLLGSAGIAAGAVVGAVSFGPPEAGAGRASGLPPLSPESVVERAVAGPAMAVAGAALLLAVGLFVLLREPRLARLGARYDRAGSAGRALDPDRAAWRELDAGRDPTVDPGPLPGTGPGDGGRDRAV
jgi:hypothetical protein